jgi:hypothetical protein
VQEFGTCINRLFGLLKNAESAATKAEEKTPYIKRLRKFRVEAWDKTDPMTLFLGNYLSCCLATDGAQFPAIVQRIIDCAMAMTIVVDEETKQPIKNNPLTS